MKISVVFWSASALIFGIPFFVESGIIVILIVLASFLFGLKYLIEDRRELKSATYYVRMADKAQPPIWKRLLSLIAKIVLFMILYCISQEFLKDFKLPPFSGLYMAPFIAEYFTQNYQNFNNSFRSYTSGIKLPERNQEIIHWKNVEELSFVDTTIAVKAGQNENQYHIKAEDKKDFDRIIATWKNQTLEDLE
jgi:hypothetical protein